MNRSGGVWLRDRSGSFEQKNMLNRRSPRCAADSARSTGGLLSKHRQAGFGAFPDQEMLPATSLALTTALSRCY